jgi:hypothetical protein
LGLGQKNGVKRALYILLYLLPFSLTAACVVWTLTQTPFAAPLVDRSVEQTRAALERAMARNVDLSLILPRMQEAILAKDLDHILLLLQLANDHDVQLPAPMLADINALNVAASGVLARTTACGACAIDITACATLTQIGACALPFELTPAGDVNALRRAGVLYVEGGDVDRLDVGLAIVGLGATGAVLASGGSSYSIKAGTSVLRMARRLGTLTAPFAARLTTLVGDAVRWDRMSDLAALRIGPAQMVDAANLTELTDLGGSLRRVAQNTSVAEAVSLLRHVDTAEDAARLARVTDAIGPKTRGAFEVLGKTRVFRAAVRISDLAIAAATAIYLLVLQAAVFFCQQCCNVCLRTARHCLRHAVT